MVKIHRFAFWVIPFLFFALSQPGFSETFDSIAVIVGNKIVTQNEIDLAILQFSEERKYLRQEPLPPAEMKKFVLQKLVDDLLLEQMADLSGVTVGEEEVAERVSEFKTRNKLNETAFEETLRNMSFTVRQFNQAQIRNIKKQRIIGREVRSKIDISEKEIRELYEAENTKKVYKIRHLLRKTPINASEETLEKARREIVYLMEQLEKGEDFETLIKDYSEDPAAKTNLGTMEFELDNAIEALREVLLKMKPGETYPEPVRTEFGYHLVELVDIRDFDKKPYEEVKKDYRQKIFSQKYSELLAKLYEKLRRETKITFRDEALEAYYFSNS